MIKRVIEAFILMAIFVKIVESPIGIAIGTVLGILLILRIIYRLTKKNKHDIRY